MLKNSLNNASDASGFRVRKRAKRVVTTTEQGQPTPSERWYELDYINKYFALEQQRNTAGQVIENTQYSINNVYLDGVRIAAVEESGAARYFLTDQVDSVKIVTDSVGKVVSRTEYYPYGEEWFSESSRYNQTASGHSMTTDIAPKYNGQELDQESDFYYFNARHYDPQLARFVTADTVIDGNNAYSSWNRYMYVRGNPIKYKDPTGHKIVVAGKDEAFRNKVADDLSKLAGAKIELDEKGNVSLGDRLDKKSEKGYELVNRLIESDSTVDIVKKAKNGSTASKGIASVFSDDKTIAFNPNSQTTTIVKGKDKNVLQETPSHIELGHELVHADQDIRDNVFKELYQNSELTKVSTPYEVDLGDGSTFRDSENTTKINELRAIGIEGYTEKSDISENDLRRESNLAERTSHAGF